LDETSQQPGIPACLCRPQVKSLPHNLNNIEKEKEKAKD